MRTSGFVGPAVPVKRSVDKAVSSSVSTSNADQGTQMVAMRVSRMDSLVTGYDGNSKVSRNRTDS